MAINMVKGSGGNHMPAQSYPGPYRVEVFVDLADVTTEKGSAIAQGDIIEVIEVPAGSQVLFAGFQVVEAMTGTSTDTTLDFGVTGGDADCWVDGFDLDGAAAGAYASAATASITPAQTFFSAADTLDLLVATQTNTVTGGVLRVFANILDCSSRPRPAVAVVGS